MIHLKSSPYPWPFDGDLRPENTALIIIDMQTDFCGKGGYVDTMGYDINLTRAPIAPLQALLPVMRAAGFHIIHTREGHLPDLSDAPLAKVMRGKPGLRIGSLGPMGRILIRGEPGHGIIPELSPLPDEVVIDKPGKGAFYRTGLDALLQEKAIENLLVCGVTTEVCVHTTVREGNDRGYRCVVVSDGCASYFPQFHRVALEMVSAQGGIFGWVSDSASVVMTLSPICTSSPLANQ